MTAFLGKTRFPKSSHCFTWPEILQKIEANTISSNAVGYKMLTESCWSVLRQQCLCACMCWISLPQPSKGRPCCSERGENSTKPRPLLCVSFTGQNAGLSPSASLPCVFRSPFSLRSLPCLGCGSEYRFWFRRLIHNCRNLSFHQLSNEKKKKKSRYFNRHA